MPPQPAATERPRTAAARIERLAALLPADDAEKLRAAFRTREAAAELAREKLNQAFAQMQDALRAQPFEPAQLRGAVAAIRAARPAYEQAMSEIFVAGASEMSLQGRTKLADWPTRPAPSAR